MRSNPVAVDEAWLLDGFDEFANAPSSYRDGLIDAGDLLDDDGAVADYFALPRSVDDVLAEVTLFGTGPEAVRLLDSLVGRSLTDEEALAAAVAWERQARWISARCQAANVAFVGPAATNAGTSEGGAATLSLAGERLEGRTDRERAAERRDAHREEQSRVLELALGLDCSDVLLKAKLANARLLSGTLAETSRRLESGELSEYRVRRICEKLDGLDPQVAQDIEAKVLSNAADIKLASMTSKLRRLVLVAKGPAAAEEHREGVKNRRVIIDTEPSEPGLLGVHAYLPAEVAVAFREALEALQSDLAKADRAKSDESKAARKDWAKRRRAMDGGVPQHDGAHQDGAHDHDADTPCNGSCGDPSCGDDRPPAVFARRTKDQRLADALAMLVLGPDEGDPSVPARPKFLLQLTMSLPVLLALREGAAELPGYGPMPAEIAREWAQDAAWQRFVHEPVTGYLMDAGDERYKHPLAMRRFVVARDVTDRFPGSNRKARLCDLDHVEAWEPEGKGGSTSSENTQCSSRIGHVAKTHNGWTVEGNANRVLLWRSPHGLTFESTPHDYSDPPQPPWCQGPPPF